MNYLIAIDIDGTLMRDDGTISEYTKKVINEIYQKGNKIVLCSARPRYHIKHITNDIKCFEYFISSNGTEVYDINNDKVIFANYIDKKQCKKIYDSCQEEDVRVIFVSENVEYVTKFIRNNNQVLITEDNINIVLNNNIKQVMIIGEDKLKLSKLKSRFSDELNLNIVDTSEKKDEIWFSLINSESSKGIALKIIVNYLKIPERNVIAIGNDKNDISMLQQAKIGVVVENADKDVKKIADIIIKNNNVDGVAVFLQNFFANKQ